MEPIATTIKQLLGDLDIAVRWGIKKDRTETAPDENYASAQSAAESEKPLEDTAAGLCAPRARPPESRLGALAAIRRFRGDETLSLIYKTTVINPYTDDYALIETYADDQGNEYWVNPANDVLVQMGPVADQYPKAHQIRSNARIAVENLRRKATALSDVNVPGFAARKNSLHPLEDNKNREIYFFRWDDFSAPVTESEMPPFVQIGICATGEVKSFTNTLTR